MSDEIYKIPDLAEGRIYRVEQTIKRSRFITSIAHTNGVEEAKLFVEKVKAEFPDAKHNCWAYCAGAAGQTAFVGASDDGEPHGTAGRPMLTVLLHSGVGEITAVVTRYFGGILLGTGGLVKAYQSSVKQALDTLPITDKTILSKVLVTVDFKFINQLQNLLPKFDAVVDLQNFGANAAFSIKLPVSQVEGFVSAITNVTAGSAVIELPKD